MSKALRQDIADEDLEEVWEGAAFLAMVGAIGGFFLSMVLDTATGVPTAIWASIWATLVFIGPLIALGLSAVALTAPVKDSLPHSQQDAAKRYLKMDKETKKLLPPNIFELLTGDLTSEDRGELTQAVNEVYFAMEARDKQRARVAKETAYDGYTVKAAIEDAKAVKDHIEIETNTMKEML